MSDFDARTISDHIFEKLEASILRGELPPGTRISEALLARKLGISRGPLREAIRRLEGRKLITRVARVGPTVVSLSQKDILEIFVVREALEGMACRLATQHMTASDLAELETVLERHVKKNELRSGKAYYQEPGDFDFHYRIAKGSNNSKLVELLTGELYHLVRVYRYRSGSEPGRATQAFDEHREILSAMQARDPDLAESLMRRHIARAREILCNE